MSSVDPANYASPSLSNAQTPIHEILVATDFLSNSRMALDYAAVFATRFKAHLTVFHSFEYGPYGKTVEVVDRVPCRERREAEQRVQVFASGLRHAGVNANWSVTEGEVSSAVLSSVKSLHADLLVIGTQGIHRGVGHLLLGSNAEAIMLNATCPTLTIGPHVHGGIEPTGGFERLICAIDLSPESARAAAYAMGLARDFGIEVEFYHLPEKAEGAELDRRVSAFCLSLSRLAPDAPAEWKDVHTQKCNVRALPDVLAEAYDSTALMMVGVRPASFFDLHLHTSDAYRLLAEAACPILTFPCDEVSTDKADNSSTSYRAEGHTPRYKQP